MQNTHQKQTLDVEIFSETESCLKQFLKTFYLYAPDDVIIIKSESRNKPNIFEREKRFKFCRQKILDEISFLYECLERSGKENGPKIFEHLDGLKSVYKAKQKAFEARSPTFTFSKELFCAAKMELIRREAETDSAFA